ncbi:MAG: clan AA aspartic protease [Bacteroidetes bacterium]|nr:clan AA aspartic protease [Bacteroidota bacterium]
MGIIHANIKLSNPVNRELNSIEVKSLVDTRALHLCIPEHLKNQLDLKELEKREVTIADGTKKMCSYVGPVKIEFKNRSCFTGALVLGDTALLGAIPMEDMDLVINPAKLSLTVNPENPNIPGGVAMGLKK